MQQPTKTQVATPLFKDFEKPIKDLFSVGFADVGAWKVEVKDKHDSGKLYVNPVASAGAGKPGKLQIEFGYKASCGGAIKVKSSPEDDMLSSEWTASYNFKGQNIVATAQKKNSVCAGQCPMAMSLAHDGIIQLPSAIQSKLHIKNFAAHEKMDCSSVDVGFAFPMAPHCFFGLGSVYNCKENKCNWKLASRYSHPTSGVQVFMQTAALKDCTAGVKVPFKCIKCPCSGKQMPAAFGAKVNYNSKTQKPSGEAVFEIACAGTGECPLSKIASSTTLKVKINSALNVVGAMTMNISHGWSASFSIDKSLKAGCTFTHA